MKWRVETTEAVAATSAFREWFEAHPSVPGAVVAANDAITKVTSLGPDRYEARVEVGTFPLVSLTPIMSFVAERNDKQVAVTVEDQRMEASGPAWATRIVLAAANVMDTKSTSRFFVDDNDFLTCSSVVETSFDLPKWIPIPVHVIQDSGITGIQKQVSSDLQLSLQNLLEKGPSGALAPPPSSS